MEENSGSGNTVKKPGYKDVRKASGNDRQIQMSLTGFVERGKRYEITKMDNGFVAEVYD